MQLAAAGPIYAGILAVVLRQAAGQTVAMSVLFGQFDKTGPIIVVLCSPTS